MARTPDDLKPLVPAKLNLYLCIESILVFVSIQNPDCSFASVPRETNAVTCPGRIIETEIEANRSFVWPGLQDCDYYPKIDTHKIYRQNVYVS